MSLNPLQDTEFLRKLDSVKNRQNYVRIISLDLNDNPREAIEGKVTSGSINVNGKSAVRRTCNLSLTALPESQITDYYWVFETKFKLEIGLQNDIDDRYPKIIWFKQGTYVINSFSASKNTNNISISISGQDKMCRINGEVSGNFMHQTNLGQIETVDDYGNILIDKLTIKDIIINMMTEFGGERIENIIINDLDEYGYELWDYRGDVPMYLFYDDKKREVVTFSFDQDTKIYFFNPGTSGTKDILEDLQIASASDLGISSGTPYMLVKITHEDMTEGPNPQPTYFSFQFQNKKETTKYCWLSSKDIGLDYWFYDASIYNELVEFYFTVADTDTHQTLIGAKAEIKLPPSASINNTEYVHYYSFNTLDPQVNQKASLIKLDANDTKTYRIIKIEYGETAGYHKIPLVFNTDLIANVNETITSVLDKLVKMLGDFEYFYDLEGRFVFQKKQTYETELFSPINGELIEPTVSNKIYSYIFEDESKFTSISTPPNLKNLKNDFAVWGSRKTAAGTEVPIHTRYAIDKKPTIYHTTRDVPQHIREKDLYHYIEADIVKYENDRLIYEIVTFPKNNYAYYYPRPNLTEKEYQDNKGLKRYKYLVFKKDLSEDKIQEIENNEKNPFSGWGMCHQMPDGAYRNYYPKGLPIQYREKGTDGEDQSNYHELKIYDSNGKAINITYDNYNTYATQIMAAFDFDKNYYYFSDQAKLFYTVDMAQQKCLIDINNNIVLDTNGDKTLAETENAREVDWREIIYQMSYDYRQGDKDFAYRRTLESRNPWYRNGYTGYEQYYTDIEGFWRQLYSPYEITYSDYANYGDFYANRDGKWKYWNKKIHTDPASFNFWFDFLDTEGELDKFSAHRIQPRTKAVNENTIKSIYYKEVPEILYVITPQENIKEDSKMAYVPIQISENVSKMFYRSGQGISAITRTNGLIYQHAGCTETINVTSIPIYYLQPNTRIQVKSEDYKIDTLSFQLTYNGMMNISGSKIIKQFI